MDPDTPLEETMGALDQIVRSGKALYVGLSNYDGETMKRAAAILEDLHCPFIINQNSYNIFNRTIEENGLKQAAADGKKGIISFSPLAQGMLTDRYLNGIPKDSRVNTCLLYTSILSIPLKLEGSGIGMIMSLHHHINLILIHQWSKLCTKHHTIGIGMVVTTAVNILMEYHNTPFGIFILIDCLLYTSYITIGIKIS